MNAGCQERYKHTSVSKFTGARIQLRSSVPIAKALDLFRPTYDVEQRPIPLDGLKPHTSRINITFRFYRPGKPHSRYVQRSSWVDFHPSPSAGLGARLGGIDSGSKIIRQGTPYCKCGIPTYVPPIPSIAPELTRQTAPGGSESQSEIIYGYIPSERRGNQDRDRSIKAIRGAGASG
jgi:hypothetical protein